MVMDKCSEGGTPHIGFNYVKIVINLNYNYQHLLTLTKDTHSPKLLFVEKNKLVSFSLSMKMHISRFS